VQCYHLPNCTGKLVVFFQRFITVRPLARRCWHVWEIQKSYYLCYHFRFVCLPFDNVAELTCWLRWCALKYNLNKSTDISTVIVVIGGAYCSQNYIIVNIIISVINYNRTKHTAQYCICWNIVHKLLMPFKLLSNKTAVFVTPVLIHIFTPHQQMADTLSLLLLDPLHPIDLNHL